MKTFLFHEFISKIEDQLIGKKFSDMAIVAIGPEGMAVAGMATAPIQDDDPAVVLALFLVGIESTAKKLVPEQKSRLAIAVKELASQIERG